MNTLLIVILTVYRNSSSPIQWYHRRP